MKKILDAGEIFVKHFATVEQRPEYRATKGGGEDPTSPRRTGVTAVPRIGIMPGNYGEVDGGVLVEVVSKDGPAEKAGIKQGDRIVDINGKPIKNMDGYMSAMGAQKPGVEIPIIIIRDEKKMTVKVVPNPPTP
jgi:S1-C subfamily serine protease